MRYSELKYEGKTYTEQWKIDEILIEKKFKWLLSAEIENARLEILNDTLIWNAGIWYNGNWIFGVFRDGEWKYGTWENGVWYNGKWKDGVFKSGIIYNGIFVKGQILGGEIRGGKFIDCKIGSRVIEYVEGEKEQEQQELQTPVIEPVDAQSDLHVVVKEKNIIQMKNLKRFNEYIKENTEYATISPDDVFSYMDLNQPEWLDNDEYQLSNLTNWDENFDFSGEQEDIDNYFDGRNIINIRLIDDSWELTFDCEGEHDEFISYFVRAVQNLLGFNSVIIDNPKYAKFLESVSIKESTGDLKAQFAGNGYANVNVEQEDGYIEMSSYSETDIYNLKKIHGGDVIVRNGMYILVIKDKK